MRNFTFYSPTEFVFGRKTEEQVGILLKKYGASKVLIHFGGGSIIKSGLLPRIETLLKAENIKYILFGGAQPNPRSGLVYQGIKLCKRENIDFILAVGGGSAIDSAKAIAAGAKYDGDFWDFFDGTAIIKAAIKIGVILTLPASGSEGSHRSVITKEEGMLKRGAGNEFIRPVFSIINPELTFTLPAYQTAAGIVDMMSHIFERYLTKTPNVDLTDRLCEATLVSIIEAGRKVMDDPYDYEARATLCWSGTIAHNGILGVGRVEDWATHQLEHELSARYDVTHGAGLAVMFPAYMKYALDTDINRFQRLAINVWGVESGSQTPTEIALNGISAMKTFFKKIGMPTSFSEIGALEKDIDFLVSKLFQGKSNNFGAFKSLTPEGARMVYRIACE
ncbi:MAG: iron-containing alcohol dehydrogenase [Candidatus Izemoplasmatales bacterium]|nr:iron-containing alcohol dehydrogenase [Candidatus Izemoplasmatales bacterium]MDD3865553.1 iron-containing alcohol dehydrogenase [Candidatus Izemoplasmatales bacterium]